MIAPNSIAQNGEIAENQLPETDVDSQTARAADFLLLARYGRVPQIARFAGFGEAPERGKPVVVSTERGEELATVLQVLPVPRGNQSAPALTGELLRAVADSDTQKAETLLQRAEDQFAAWLQRVSEWKLQLELIDTEFTLDERLILYVLNDRNAETTRMALLAAAGGHGIVHVQPVSSEGIVQETSGGGCGSCSDGGCH